MTPQERGELAGHVARYRLCLLLQVAAVLAGLVGMIWHGVASIMAGCFMAWLCHLMKPEPTDSLDRITGRRP